MFHKVVSLTPSLPLSWYPIMIPSRVTNKPVECSQTGVFEAFCKPFFCFLGPTCLHHIMKNLKFTEWNKVGWIKHKHLFCFQFYIWLCQNYFANHQTPFIYALHIVIVIFGSGVVVDLWFQHDVFFSSVQKFETQIHVCHHLFSLFSSSSVSFQMFGISTQVFFSFTENVHQNRLMETIP